MNLLFFAFLWFIFDFFFLMFLFVKSFRFLKMGKKVSSSDLLKSFLFVYLVPNVFLLILTGILRRSFFEDSALMSVLSFMLFLFVWFFSFGKIVGLTFKKSFIFLVVYFVLSISVRSVQIFFIKPYSVPAGSMEDTLLRNDYFIANQIYYGHSFFNQTQRYFQFHKPKRNDILVFVYPKDHSRNFVKRCVGIPGDVLECKDKVLFVNSVKQEELFVKHESPVIEPRGYKVLFSGEQQPDSDGPLSKSTNATRDNFGPVTVLPGHYFMLGDNRDNSWDSRYWGQLDEKLIKGKAEAVYWRGKTNSLLLKEIQ